MMKVEKKNPIYGIGAVSNENILGKLKNFGVYKANDALSRNFVRRDLSYAVKAMLMK